MKDIIVIGAGGCALEVIGIIEHINRNKPEWNILGLVDDNSELKGQLICGYPVLGKIDILDKQIEKTYVVCGIGNPSIRKKVTGEICNQNIIFPVLVDPSAVVANDVTIGAGTIIGAGVLCEKKSVIGRQVMINSHSIVGHETIIKDFCMVHLGANIAGQVELEACCEIGMGTNIIQQLKLGVYTVTGAGSVVVRNIPGKCVVAGVPAKIIRELQI